MCVFTSCFHTATLMLSWMVMNRKESFCVVWSVWGDVTKLQNIQDTTHCGCFVNMHECYVSVCSYLRWRCPLFYVCIWT